MTDYALVVFDWDGTLMDSASAIVGGMQIAIQRAGLPERTPAQLRALIGLGINDVIARLFPERDTAQVRSDLARVHATQDDASARAALFPGAFSALLALRAAGYRLAIATGKSRYGLDRALAATGTAHLFELSRCADESVAKPAPHLVRDLLVRSANPAASTLVVGDTEYDMAMARAAGVDCVGVRCGVHSDKLLRAAGARDVIDDVAALPAWLAGRPAIDDASTGS